MHLKYYFSYFQINPLLERLKQWVDLKRVKEVIFINKGLRVKNLASGKKKFVTYVENLKENSKEWKFPKNAPPSIGKHRGSVNETKNCISHQEYMKQENELQEKGKKIMKDDATNEINMEVDEWNWKKIKCFASFFKKLLISSLIIYMVNNYLFDMTLTTGSSMYPLISKNGVVLFYICNDALVVANKLYNLYTDSRIYFWKMTHYFIKFLFSPDRFCSYNEKILKQIEESLEQKRKKKNVYNRGDVVILYSPVNDQKRICKRIVAIENDRIYINYPNAFVQIPKNCVWVEGDNKEDSYDSRNYGSVPTSMLIGRAFFLLDPFTKFAFIKNENDMIVKNRDRYQRLAD